jgi:hypothetical protein
MQLFTTATGVFSRFRVLGAFSVLGAFRGIFRTLARSILSVFVVLGVFNGCRVLAAFIQAGTGGGVGFHAGTIRIDNRGGRGGGRGRRSGCRRATATVVTAAATVPAPAITGMIPGIAVLTTVIGTTPAITAGLITVVIAVVGAAIVAVVNRGMKRRTIGMREVRGPDRVIGAPAGGRNQQQNSNNGKKLFHRSPLLFGEERENGLIRLKLSFLR